MSQLKIYRASAGSGKTYTLSGEFIKLLMADPQNYKVTLAVTFTNKATSEMKTRILENLYSLATKDDADYMDDIIKLTGKTPKQIKATAKAILYNILNDFSNLSVNTIDSFFQKVIRSFAFEAGLPAGFKVELDTDRVLKQAIDDLLREIDVDGNEDIKNWVINHALSKIELGGSWNINQELFDLGKEVFKEKFQSLTKDELARLQDKKLLLSYSKQLDDIIKAFEEDVKKLAGHGLELMDKHGVSWNILYKKTLSPLKRLIKLKDLKSSKDVLEIKVLAQYINDPDATMGKKPEGKDQAKVYDWFNGGFNDVLIGLNHLFENHRSKYFTAKIIKSNLNALGIITDIAKKVRSIAQNENLFLLADANRILHQIIDDNDAPFIYEKTGGRYHHYMIDEFQDTSRLQWNNFRPLIDNSISQDYTALIVGDVKQSIYRWRNSDWKLLSEQVEQDLDQYGIDLQTLTTNWRSYENIIHFNNAVFLNAANILQNNFNNTAAEGVENVAIPESLHARIKNAYFDTIQKVSPKAIGTGGKVKVAFLETGRSNDVFEEASTQRAVEEVEKLLQQGYQYKDICILVRQKTEGQRISQALLSGEFSETKQTHPVVSNETLLLGSSPAVNMVIQQLKYIQSPDDPVCEAYVRLFYHFYQQNDALQNLYCEGSELVKESSQNTGEKHAKTILALKGQPLFEMVECLIRKLPNELYTQQYSFLQGLLDKVRNYILNKSVNAHDFISWWDDKGKNTSISISDGQNAISVLTIHKSKGLEFKAVVMPYCNWGLDDRKRGSLMWSNPLTEPFNTLNPVPINYGNTLIHSEFIEPYLTEFLHQYVDNLNLLYVAFTRACESLIVLAEKPSKSAHLSNVSHLLYQIVTSININKHEDIPDNLWDEAWKDDEMLFEFGEIAIKQTLEDEEPKPKLSVFKTNDPGDRIRLHPESTAMQSIDTDSQLKYGKIMHALFEHIKYADDVKKAVQLLVLDGKIKSSQKDELINFTQKVINNKKVKAWFDESNKVINEGTILLKKGSYRPDRVIVNEQKTIVVDYKFGELHNENYKYQVANYMRILKNMGYKNLEGYVWYVGEQSTIDPVSLEPMQGKLF